MKTKKHYISPTRFFDRRAGADPRRPRGYRLLVAAVLVLVTVGPLTAKSRYVPGHKTKTYTTKKYQLKLRARHFQQGDIILINIFPLKQGAGEVPKPKAWLGKRNIVLEWEKKSWSGLLGIYPWEKPGQKNLRIRFYDPAGESQVYVHPFYAAKAPFVKDKISLKISKKFTGGKKTAKELALIKLGKKLKRKAFALRTKRKWKGPFMDPRNLAPVNSPFYKTRIYNGKPSSPHSGVDLKGKTGAPIRAMNHARVVLARKLFYEGNIVILDHGEGIFTYYLHQSKIAVKEGQMVKTGQLIGYVGATGMVTGPHLHLSLIVHGRLHSPLSLLSLPLGEE